MNNLRDDFVKFLGFIYGQILVIEKYKKINLVKQNFELKDLRILIFCYVTAIIDSFQKKIFFNLEDGKPKYFYTITFSESLTNVFKYIYKNFYITGISSFLRNEFYLDVKFMKKIYIKKFLDKYEKYLKFKIKDGIKIKFNYSNGSYNEMSTRKMNNINFQYVFNTYVPITFDIIFDALNCQNIFYQDFRKILPINTHINYSPTVSVNSYNMIDSHHEFFAPQNKYEDAEKYIIASSEDLTPEQNAFKVELYKFVNKMLSNPNHIGIFFEKSNLYSNPSNQSGDSSNFKVLNVETVFYDKDFKDNKYNKEILYLLKEYFNYICIYESNRNINIPILNVDVLSLPVIRDGLVLICERLSYEFHRNIKLNGFYETRTVCFQLNYSFIISSNIINSQSPSGMNPDAYSTSRDLHTCFVDYVINNNSSYDSIVSKNYIDCISTLTYFSFSPLITGGTNEDDYVEFINITDTRISFEDLNNFVIKKVEDNIYE